MKVKRFDTRSNSFKLKRVKPATGEVSPYGNAPATPGAFEYYSTKPNVSGDVYGQRRRSSSEDEDIPLAIASPEYRQGKKKSPQNEEKKSKCQDCWSRFCWKTFFASMLTMVGAGMFTIDLKLVSDLYLGLLQEVMHINWKWLEAASIIMTALGSLIMALSLTIFIFSCLSPSSGGPGHTRMPHVVFLCLLYVSFLLWMFFFAVSVGFGMLTLILEGVCDTDEIKPLWSSPPDPSTGETCTTILEGEDCIDCIDLYQFHFLFPPYARKEDMWLCGEEIYELCALNLPLVATRWLLCLIGASLALVGLSLHMTLLTYERTKLGEEKKLNLAKEGMYINRRIDSALNRQSYRTEY